MLKSMMRLGGAATVFVFLSGCATEVRDLTGTLRYQGEHSRQNVRVDVLSDQRIAAVDVLLPPSPSEPTERAQPMTPDWLTPTSFVAEVTTPRCAPTLAYSVRVRTGEGWTRRTLRFPEAGRFTHAIQDRPTDCGTSTDGYARRFAVNSVEDFVDRRPGDGRCEGIDSRGETRCSLRAAVMEANAGPGGNLIRLEPRRYRLTRARPAEFVDPVALDEAVGDLDILKDMTIEGRDGWTLSASVFLAPLGTAVSLQDDPARDGTFAKIDGGGIDRVFQVAAGATLRLRNLAVVGGNGGTGGGGGILNAGTTTLERVAVVGNRARSPGGNGAGILNPGVLVAEDSLFAWNVPPGSTAFGGFLSSRGTATIRRSLIAFNGAQFGSAIHNQGRLRIENATLFHNDLQEGTVGARYVVSNNGSGRVEMVHATIVERTPLRTLVLSNPAGARAFALANTLISYGEDRPICNRAGVTSLGGNLMFGSCALAGAGATDRVGGRYIMVGQLQDMGGFAPVAAVWPGTSGESAIDRASSAFAPLTDQRGAGYSRRLDGTTWGAMGPPDIGAHEYDPSRDGRGG